MVDEVLHARAFKLFGLGKQQLVVRVPPPAYLQGHEKTASLVDHADQQVIQFLEPMKTQLQSMAAPTHCQMKETDFPILGRGF
jgi:hypothetical protein